VPFRCPVLGHSGRPKSVAFRITQLSRRCCLPTWSPGWGSRWRPHCFGGCGKLTNATPVDSVFDFREILPRPTDDPRHRCRHPRPVDRVCSAGIAATRSSPTRPRWLLGTTQQRLSSNGGSVWSVPAAAAGRYGGERDQEAITRIKLAGQRVAVRLKELCGIGQATSPLHRGSATRMSHKGGITGLVAPALDDP
jgi:hypothetical protein